MGVKIFTLYCLRPGRRCRDYPRNGSEGLVFANKSPDSQAEKDHLPLDFLDFAARRLLFLQGSLFLSLSGIV